MDSLLPYLLADAKQRKKRRKRKTSAAEPTQKNRAAAQAANAGGRLSPAQQTGQRYETRALILLQDNGLQCLARNLRVAGGEIDLAMRDGDTLVLVEVRARAAPGFGGAAASITRKKQRRLGNTAALLLPELARAHWQGRMPAVRFDAVLFENNAPHWVRGAFTIDE